jgi:peptidoglycan/LPS O-acetylase OafA/YrhL
MLKLFELLYLVVPAVVGLIAVERRRRRGEEVDRVAIFLFWYLVLAVGVAGLLDGFSQMFDPDATADLNDWPESQAFIELGMMNFSFGVLGICCIKAKGSWRYAAGVGYAIFLLLAAYYHLHDAYGNGNHSDGNTGPSLWSDIGVATLLLVLCWLDSRKSERWTRSPSS